MNNSKLFIPENIIHEVWNKWFYLHKWLKYNDIINILQNKLITFIHIFWKYIFIILLILSLIIIPLLGNIIYISYVLWFFVFVWIIALIYLLIIWIQYSYFILKNSFIVLTHCALVINGKIINISNYEAIEAELIKVETLFQKKLFWDNEKIFSYQNLREEFKSWFHEIYQKKVGSIVFLLLIMYGIYIIIMSFIYFIWSIVIMLLSIFLSIINKFLLIQLWHTVISIHSLFWDIETSSDMIQKFQKNIQILLSKNEKQAYENSFIHALNSEIIQLNKNIEKSIDLNWKLKNEIKNSQYKDIYDFNIYNSWIKKELYMPLHEFKILLESNLNDIHKQINKLNNTIEKQKDENKKVLELQKMRLDLFWKNIYDRIEQINYYLTSLKNG